MTIKVSKETVDIFAAWCTGKISLEGECDLCGRPVHGLFGMLEANQLKKTGQTTLMLLQHKGGAFSYCINPKAEFIIE